MPNMIMNKYNTSVRLLLLLLSLLLMHGLATATELQCKVVEINSGDTISVVNGSGPMRVKLKAIAAPELEQPWGDVARQHLSDLILGQTVMVRLTGLSADKNIVGVVYLNKADIGQQMLRDGVAWYDERHDSGLDERERQLYLASVKAAQEERRGIWQQDAPVSPWEFRQARAEQAAIMAAQNSRPKNSEGAALVRPKKMEVRRPSTASWVKYAPDDESFSVLLPPVTVETPLKVPNGVSFHQAVNEGIAYQIFRGPNIAGLSPDEVFKNMMGFQTAFHDSAREHGISADIYPEKDLPPLNGFKGKQYEVFVNNLHSVMRLYISRRYVYVFGVVGGYEGDPRVDTFMSSFTMGRETDKQASKPGK